MKKKHKLPEDMQKAWEQERKALPQMVPTMALSLLKENPRHGYEIMKEGNNLLQKHFDANFEFDEKLDYFTPSNTYPALHKMEKQGLLKSHWEGRKKFYSITPKGLKDYQLRKTIMLESMKMMAILFKEMFHEEVI
ncbi:PadR family transcriptional regulator [archaeon]|nr:PadR family transcriptional regulator [archaeon]